MAKVLTFSVDNAHARQRLYRAINLLFHLTRSKSVAADVLGITRQAFLNALAEEPTKITLDQVKRAARSYALDVKDDFTPYAFAAVQAIVQAIDPQADIAYRSGSTVDNFPEKMRQYLVDHWDKPLSKAVHHFAGKDFKPKYLRQVIKRLIDKHPLLALRAVEPDDQTPDDRVNKYQKIVTEPEYAAAHEGRAGKQPLRVVAKARVKQAEKLAKKFATKEKTEQGPSSFTITQVKKRKVTPQEKPIRPDKPPKDPRQEPVEHKTKPPIKVKKDPAAPPSESTAIDKIIADREAGKGPSPAVAARLAKLLAQ